MMKGIGARQGRVAAVAVAALAAIAVPAGSAAAKPSGEKTHGKEIVRLECEGLGPVTVSVPPSENNNGAGQIVGAKGHGIPVSFTTTITDVRTGEVLSKESRTVGRGHRNQPTIGCTGTFEAPAEQFFEGATELPEGVEPGDVIRGIFELQVILKR